MNTKPSTTQTINPKEMKQWLVSLHTLQSSIIQPVTPDEIHSDKDFRGIFDSPGAILEQLSGEIPLGHYGYGASVADPVGEVDARCYRYLVSQALAELTKGHIRLVGPTRSGKSEFLFKLVTNLAKKDNFSIVWFSTKWQEDKAFFETFFPEHTVISANEIPLTRLTKGRFNPLSRIKIRNGRIDPLDCRKLAESLIELIPIENLSGETEKFLRDAVVRLAAILELLKYQYRDSATLEQLLDLWVVLPQGMSTLHPLESLLQSNAVPIEAQQRLRRHLLPLLQPQPAHEAMVGPTAQQLLSQIESLASVLAANDLPNFGDRLRRSSQGQVLVIDQSDGMNSSVSKGMAKLIFPLLYEDLVAQCPSNWRESGMRPVLMVVDEMNTLLGAGGEFSDFMEKAASKGVVMAFGQQSTAGNPDPRLNAAMSNNTRLQVVFSGCHPNDPAVQEIGSVAGNFPSPLEPHRVEDGYGNLPRLPIDAIASLGPLASLVRVKSTTAKDRIMWVYQGNPLIPYRQELLALRQELAVAIATQQDRGSSVAELLELYEETEALLWQSYGYWNAVDLKVGYASLNLEAIDRAYEQTMAVLERQSKKQRELMKLEASRGEFARAQSIELTKDRIQQQWQLAKETEAWLWQSFLQDFLPEIQKFKPWWAIWNDPPISKPTVEWWQWRANPAAKQQFMFFSWGSDYPTRVAQYWNAVLEEYKKYAEAFGQQNLSLWHNGLDTLVSWRVSQLPSGSSPHPKFGSLSRWLSGNQ